MLTDNNRWERRFDSVLLALAWLTLAVGVVLTSLESEGQITVQLVAAAIAAAVYVVGLQFVPRRLLRERRRLTAESVALVGSALTMAAVGLTGGPNSHYLLLSLTPVLFGAFFGGFRIGIATAAFSGALLFAQSVPVQAEQRLPEMVQWGFLYGLVAVTFAQARRLLVEEQQRASAFAAATEEAQVRLARLEHANQLLNRLNELADSSELNPIEVGEAALDGLANMVDMKAGMAAIASETGPVVVARRGAEEAGDEKVSFPLTVGDREVGVVMLSSDTTLSAAEQDSVTESLRPVALAFSNVQLLQDIARRAIREERARLARELHDEIGPSLASLGLAVDLAMLQNPTEPAMASHLQDLRSSVGGLVDEIRATVADLRQEEQPSLTEAIQRTIKKIGPVASTFVLQLDERRPPRPSIGPDVSSIVTEAVRNAVRHSGATTITVHGETDFDHGSVTVHDDGSGFARASVPDGHFGLIGMDERAQKIGASLNIVSSSAGTAVTVTWGDE